MEERKAGPVAVASWISYDIANTVFWVGVVGLAFPLWLTKDQGGDDAMLGYTMSATMVAVLVLSPFCGSYSDQTGKRIPLLMATTLLCAAVTLLIDTGGGILVSLGLFALALCMMELGTVFYNSLLTEVSTLANRGFIAGMGVGIGYLGSFMAVGTSLLVSDRWGYVVVFRVVSLLFLLFALPIFLFLRERAGEARPSAAEMARQAWRQLTSNLRSMDRFPGLRTYLAARFLLGIGVSTATGFAVVYASETIGLTDQDIQVVLIAGISVAIPCGLLWGRVVDRIGARFVLIYGLMGWLLLLLIALAIPWLSWTTHLWWAVGLLTGVSVSCVFTADRPMVMSLTPPEYVGEFFGLHSMVGKLARVLGYFMWAFIAVTLGFGQPAAVVSLMVCLVLACLLLLALRIPARSPAAEPSE